MIKFRYSLSQYQDWPNCESPKKRFLCHDFRFWRYIRINLPSIKLKKVQMKNQAKHLALSIILAIVLIGCTDYKEYDLAIENADIFNSKNGTITKNKTVLVKADTIAAIVDLDQSFSALETIDGNNRLLVPGFIDTHVHLIGNYGVDADDPNTYEAEELQMIRDLSSYHYLNYGVTSIIEMGQPETWMDVTLDWQKNPSPLHPNLFICGGSIVSDEDRRQPAHHIEVMSPEDGREKVRSYAKKGLKYMKLYRKLRKPDFEAMADEAIKQGIIVNTHVDNNVVTIQEAMDFGVMNFEHFFTVTPSILSYGEHWPSMNERYNIRMSPSIDEFTAHMVFFFSYIKEHPEFEDNLVALFEKMASEGATLSTALNVLASVTGKSDFFTSFEYFPIRKEPMVSYNEVQQAQLEDAYRAMMSYIKKAHEMGVKLRIGTDCRNGGRALLSELMLLSKAGIPMADVLQIATRNGYEAMRMEEQWGVIEVGKKADMLLFEKDPFESPENLLSEKTVIKDGQLVQIKRSVAYELQEVLLNEEGSDAASWLKNAQLNDDFSAIDPYQMKKVVKELLGGGKVEEAMKAYQFYTELFPDRKMEIDGTVLTNACYGLLRQGEEKKAMTFYSFAEQNFPKAKRYLGLAVLLQILEHDIEAGKKEFYAHQDSEAYILDENEINGVGYLLIQFGKLKEAIAVFELNVAAFPESWNVYDSLGEAHLEAGNKQLAIANYKKSVALNPDNNYGIAALKELGVR